MHTPVLQKEVLEYLNPKANENFVDCTLGFGGHSLAVLQRTDPEGKVLGIEADPELCKKVLARNIERLIIVNDSYCNLKKIVEEKKFGPLHGILLDLGLSSWHLERSGRGFTFQKQEPLDMRYRDDTPLRAETIVNSWSRGDIEKILKEYGQERFASRIAKKIVGVRGSRKIENTFQLVEIINKAVPASYRRGRINPATRTFQALRIAVNDELNNLRKVLPQTVDILSQGGRLVVISFHSLEDRIVKNFLKENKLKILTKSPVTPGEEEIRANPSSRSAKLRAAIRQTS